MRYFIRLSIPCGIGSSSQDMKLYKEVPEEEILLHPSYYKPIQDYTYCRRLGFKVFYIVKNVFYKKIRQDIKGWFLDISHTRLYREYKIIKMKQGWKEQPSWLKNKMHKYFDISEKLRAKRRKRLQYVIPRWSAHLQVDDYKGGFSDTLFQQECLQTYLKNKGCHGYIGHAARTYKLDAFLEEAFLSSKTKIDINLTHLLAIWLTSSDGRHYADSLGEMSFKEQQKSIRQCLPHIITRSYVYSLPEHEGTAMSTQKLLEKYKGEVI